MTKKKNKIFDLQQVGYTDLDGKYIKITFPQKDFANALYSNAGSIDMDNFAREIHKEGKSELTENVIVELLQVIPSLYGHRAAQALIDYINTLKQQ